MKRSKINSNKHGIYELPHEFSNDLMDLRKLGKIRKISKLNRIITQRRSPPQTQNPFILAENCWQVEIKPCRIALFHMKTRVCLIYFVDDYSWKQFFASNSPGSPSNLIFKTILVTMRLFTQLQFKIRATKLQKSAKILSYLITTLPTFSLRSKFSIERL